VAPLALLPFHGADHAHGHAAEAVMSAAPYWMKVTVRTAKHPDGRYSYKAVPHPIVLHSDEDARTWAALYLRGLGGEISGKLMKDGVEMPVEARS
jgi:hypothetical protein